MLQAEPKRSTTRGAADYLSSFQPEQLPPRTQRAARRCLIDFAGAAIAGSCHPAAAAARRAARALFPGTTATVCGAEMPLSVIGAAFSNSMAASVLDVDDGHRLACGHPGAAVIPAVLAVAEEIDASDRSILTAIALGYEIGIRVAAARRPSSAMSVSSGRWAGVGVAAAAAWLRNMDAVTMAHALAIAEVLSPNQLAADLSGYLGSETKEGIPWSVATGLTAVTLAETGISGYLGALDFSQLYSPLCFARQHQGFLIETIYFKPYGCCRWIHSAVDTLISLMKEHDIRSEDIDYMIVETFAAASALNNVPDPPDLVSAQFSIPYVLAVAAILGTSALLPLVEPSVRC
ncbi:MAG: MmgE/PrpD family protein, partial [Acidobacteriales bacterium]|nr:MmgE/PrpD family protein [Terriglobales bacterium]